MSLADMQADVVDSRYVISREQRRTLTKAFSGTAVVASPNDGGERLATVRSWQTIPFEAEFDEFLVDSILLSNKKLASPLELPASENLSTKRESSIPISDAVQHVSLAVGLMSVLALAVHGLTGAVIVHPLVGGIFVLCSAAFYAMASVGSVEK